MIVAVGDENDVPPRWRHSERELIIPEGKGAGVPLAYLPINDPDINNNFVYRVSILLHDKFKTCKVEWRNCYLI